MGGIYKSDRKKIKIKSICKYLERASHGHLGRIRGEPRGGLDRVQARTVSNPKPSGKFGKKQTSPRYPTWSTTWWQKRMMTEQERHFAWKALWKNFGNWRFRLEVSLRVKCDKLACRPNRIVSRVKWGGTLQTSYPAG